MVEWHLPLDYIMNNWTDELLDLMMEKLVERKEREVQTIQPKSLPGDPGGHKVPDNILFARAGNLIKVVKKGV